MSGDGHPKRCLIIANPEDLHTFTIFEAMAQKGAAPDLWLTPDYPELQSISLRIDDKGQAGVRIVGRETELRGPYDVVWNRRGVFHAPLQDLHAADRAFAREEARAHYRAALELLAQQGLWINPPSAKRLANMKPLQQQAAMRLGLRTAETLYSNDPAEIRAFLARAGGSCIYKANTQKGFWIREDGVFETLYTSVIDASQLTEDEVLRMTPGIFQPVIPKKHEIRVTVMGDRLFAARLLSQETATGRVDFRQSYAELKAEREELPEPLATQLVRLTRELGLVYGAIDLIVTPDDEVVFLEINESGQFLWIEAYAGVPVLDAFCELLLQGRRDFLWQERDCIRLSDVGAAALQRRDLALQGHRPPPQLGVREAEFTSQE
ncbi:MAG: hypothetical protein WAM82_33330 [Thermoanaerobaculia bacterium]